MKIKQTILVGALLIGSVGFFATPMVSAVSCGGVETSVVDCGSIDSTDGYYCPDGTDPYEHLSELYAGSIDEPTYIATYNHTPTKCKDSTTPVLRAGYIGNTGIWRLLLLVINILTAGIGIAAVGGIVYGSILYTSAGGDPGSTKKAKEILTNVVIGLVAYAFMYSFLNFIIPGGIFA